MVCSGRNRPWFLERVVGWEPVGATFAAGGGEPHEQLTAGGVERCKPELVESAIGHDV